MIANMLKTNKQEVTSSQTMFAKMKQKFILPKLNISIADAEGAVVDVNSNPEGQQASENKDPVCAAPIN